MANNPKEPKIVEIIPSVEQGISAIASSQAPIILFDMVGAHGTYGGIAHFTLLTQRFLPAPDGSVFVDHVVSAHLRTNLIALKALKTAIEGIEGLLSTPEGQTVN